MIRPDLNYQNIHAPYVQATPLLPLLYYPSLIRSTSASASMFCHFLTLEAIPCLRQLEQNALMLPAKLLLWIEFSCYSVTISQRCCGFSSSSDRERERAEIKHKRFCLVFTPTNVEEGKSEGDVRTDCRRNASTWATLVP